MSGFYGRAPRTGRGGAVHLQGKRRFRDAPESERHRRYTI